METKKDPDFVNIVFEGLGDPENQTDIRRQFLGLDIPSTSKMPFGTSRNIYYLNLNSYLVVAKESNFGKRNKDGSMLPVSPEDEIRACILFQTMLNELTRLPENVVWIKAERPIGILTYTTPPSRGEKLVYTVYERIGGGYHGDVIQYFDDPPIRGASFVPKYFILNGIMEDTVRFLKSAIDEFLGPNGERIVWPDFDKHQLIVEELSPRSYGVHVVDFEHCYIRPKI